MEHDGFLCDPNHDHKESDEYGAVSLPKANDSLSPDAFCDPPVSNTSDLGAYGCIDSILPSESSVIYETTNEAGGSKSKDADILIQSSPIAISAGFDHPVVSERTYEASSPEVADPTAICEDPDVVTGPANTDDGSSNVNSTYVVTTCLKLTSPPPQDVGEDGIDSVDVIELAVEGLTSDSEGIQIDEAGEWDDEFYTSAYDDHPLKGESCLIRGSGTVESVDKLVIVPDNNFELLDGASTASSFSNHQTDNHTCDSQGLSFTNDPVALSSNVPNLSQRHDDCYQICPPVLDAIDPSTIPPPPVTPTSFRIPFVKNSRNRFSVSAGAQQAGEGSLSTRASLSDADESAKLVAMLAQTTSGAGVTGGTASGLPYFSGLPGTTGSLPPSMRYKLHNQNHPRSATPIFEPKHWLASGGTKSKRGSSSMSGTPLSWAGFRNRNPSGGYAVYGPPVGAVSSSTSARSNSCTINDPLHTASSVNELDLNCSRVRTGGGSVSCVSAFTVSGASRRPWSLATPDSGLLQQFDELNNQLIELQSRYSQVSSNYQKALSEIERLREEQRELNLKLSNLIDANRASEEERTAITQSYNQLKDETYALELRVQSAENCPFRQSPEVVHLIDDCKTLRKERDIARSDMQSIEASFAATREELNLCRDETQMLKGQLEIEQQERQKMWQLQHQLKNAYKLSQQLSQERDMIGSRLDAAKQELESTEEQRLRLLDRCHHTEEKVHQLEIQQDATLAEYHRVMSERDSILKENERLSEGLLSAQTKLRDADTERALLLEKLKEYKEEIEVLKSAHEMSMNNPSCGSCGQSLSSSGEVALINGAAEDLRKQLEVVKEELEESKLSVTEAQKTRDWALSERERIVSERDSVRSMSDQLRRERDEANSRLADVIKDSDDMKRQRKKVEKELKEIKERLELAEASRLVTAISPSHSRDSAIDNDMAEWEIETIPVNMSGCQHEDDLGLELGGGRDDPALGGSLLPIYVKAVAKNCRFDGLLRIYDCLIQVNNIDVANMERRSVVDILKNSKQCKMVIKRRRLVGMKLICVDFDLTDGRELGLSFEDGVYVSKIKLSSPAAKAGNIAVGDRVVYINNTPVQGKSALEVHDILARLSGTGIVIGVMKSPPVMSPMAPTGVFPPSASFMRTVCHPTGPPGCVAHGTVGTRPSVGGGTGGGCTVVPNHAQSFSLPVDAFAGVPKIHSEDLHTPVTPAVAHGQFAFRPVAQKDQSIQAELVSIPPVHGSKATSPSMAALSPSTSVVPSSISSQSNQTAQNINSVSFHDANGHHQKTLLDKIHDKMFGKGEKPKVKATATIPLDPSDLKNTNDLLRPGNASSRRRKKPFSVGSAVRSSLSRPVSYAPDNSIYFASAASTAVTTAGTSPLVSAVSSSFQKSSTTSTTTTTASTLTGGGSARSKWIRNIGSGSGDDGGGNDASIVGSDSVMDGKAALFGDDKKLLFATESAIPSLRSSGAGGSTRRPVSVLVFSPATNLSLFPSDGGPLNNRGVGDRTERHRAVPAEVIPDVRTIPVTGSATGSPEQEALCCLDDVLRSEDSGTLTAKQGQMLSARIGGESARKRSSKASKDDNKGSSGGTWPKYRFPAADPDPSSQIDDQMSGDGTVVIDPSATITAPIVHHKSKRRPPLFSVFNPNQSHDTMIPAYRSYPSSGSRSVRSPHGTSRSYDRPISYHPGLQMHTSLPNSEFDSVVKVSPSAMIQRSAHLVTPGVSSYHYHSNAGSGQGGQPINSSSHRSSPLASCLSSPASKLTVVDGNSGRQLSVSATAGAAGDPPSVGLPPGALRMLPPSCTSYVEFPPASIPPYSVTSSATSSPLYENFEEIDRYRLVAQNNSDLQYFVARSKRVPRITPPVVPHPHLLPGESLSPPDILYQSNEGSSPLGFIANPHLPNSQVYSIKGHHGSHSINRPPARRGPTISGDNYSSPPPYPGVSSQSGSYAGSACSSSGGPAMKAIQSAPHPHHIMSSSSRSERLKAGESSSSIESSSARSNRSEVSGHISPFLGGLSGGPRKICIEKGPGSSHERLGFTIREYPGNRGVFVDSVSEQSLAARHGMHVGDRLLEVNGINFRTADENQAKKVLSQAVKDERIELKIECNGDKLGRWCSGSTSRATPTSLCKSFLSREPSLYSTSTNQSHELLSSTVIEENELRVVTLDLLPGSQADWGFTLIGGNQTGVFIDDIKSEIVLNAGFLSGDRILECNGVDFRRFTLELAILDLHKYAESNISVLLQYDKENCDFVKRYKQGAGDAFYVRALVDRTPQSGDELAFSNGDILFVDHTAFNGVTGTWRAWLVDEECRKLSCGLVPSKYKWEEELLRRCSSEMSASGGAGSCAGEGDSIGGSSGSRRGTIRRSFKFIRRPSRSSHQRTPSRESQENGDGLVINTLEDGSQTFYQRVERLDYTRKRPVLVLAPLSERFVNRLVQENPGVFARCVPEVLREVSISVLDQRIYKGVYIDYRKRDKLYEATSLAAVRDIINKGLHCILDVGPSAIERLQRLCIYPVVIFIKFKNSKQIKEVDDDINSKLAKELLEHSTRLEHDFHHLFSATISAHHMSLPYICRQIQCIVEQEQKKTLWTTSKEPF